MLTHMSTTSCLGGGHDRAGKFLVGDERHTLLVVADGAGDGERGALAAQMTVDVVRDLADQIDVPLGPTGLRVLLERIDRMLLAHRAAGETTVVIAEVIEDRFWGASVGDSGAWLVHEHHHLDLTEKQHRKWRLGTGLAKPNTFGPLPLVGTLMLATDGLLECAPPHRLASAASGSGPLPDLAGQLLEEVRLPGGGLRDDVALILFRDR